MAFQQPLVPVLPVARELITKTKWLASKRDHDRPTRPSTPKLLSMKNGSARNGTGVSDGTLRKSKDLGGRPKLPHTIADAPFLSSEPETIRAPKPAKNGVRSRAISLFKRKHAHGQDSQDSIDSSDTTTSVCFTHSRRDISLTHRI